MRVLHLRHFTQFKGTSIMVFASAIVDVIDPPSPHGGIGLFRVEVWGKEPNDYVRIYEIHAKDDKSAAFEGIERFGRDITKLLEAQDHGL